jgi:ribonuclease P protein component
VSGSSPNGSSHPEGAGTLGRFPRPARLLRHADFERVYQQGQRQFAAHMTLFYLRRAPGMGPRIGFTVGRVLGGAVERNRIKRRLRQAVRGHGSIRAAVDVVIHPKKSVLTVEFQELQNEVSRGLQAIQAKLKNQASTRAVKENPE